jgi:hypothetical protein
MALTPSHGATDHIDEWDVIPHLERDSLNYLRFKFNTSNDCNLTVMIAIQCAQDLSNPPRIHLDIDFAHEEFYLNISGNVSLAWGAAMEIPLSESHYPNMTFWVGDNSSDFSWLLNPDTNQTDQFQSNEYPILLYYLMAGVYILPGPSLFYQYARGGLASFDDTPAQFSALAVALICFGLGVASSGAIAAMIAATKYYRRSQLEEALHNFRI